MSDAATSTRDSLIGATLAGRYRVEARVGSGAMGAVYRAEQAALGRRVALKIVNRDRYVGGDTVERFRREAKALSALHHPNTVRVFDFGATDDGLLYLAMELLEGEPLTEYLTREGPLPIERAIQIISQVLHSTGEAHARGIVHRDLKPDNVFLARVPSEPVPIVKVLDFGIAKAVHGDRAIDQFETLDGTVFGTPRYMSPEQAAGRPLDARSDLYAIGTMLFELVAGRPPFTDSDAVVVMARHIREEPLPLGKAAPRRPIPPSLEAVVKHALAKNPADRFQTAEQFGRALSGCLRDVRTLARLEKLGLHRSPLARLWLAPRRVVLPLAAAIVLGAGVFGWLHARSQAEAAEKPVAIKTETLTPVASPSAPSAASAEQDRTPHVVSLRPAPAPRDGTQPNDTPLDVNIGPRANASMTIKRRGPSERTAALSGEEHKHHRAEERSPAARRPRERSHKPATVPAATVEPAAPSAPVRSPYEKF